MGPRHCTRQWLPIETMQTAIKILREDNLGQQFVAMDELGKINLLNGLKLEAQLDLPKERVWALGVSKEAAQGIFNPSCVATEDGLRIIYRCEPSEATWRGYFMKDKGVPCVGTATIEDGRLVPEMPEPYYSGMPKACRPEDWRVFEHAGQHYTNFTNYYYYNEGWPMKTPHCRTAVGRLGEDRIEFLKEMDGSRAGIKMGREEKNWVFFSEGGQLYCIYSLCPYRIAKVGKMWGLYDLEERPDRLPRLGNRYIANSTNPIKVPLRPYGDVWLMFCHQFYTPYGKGTRNRTYYQHAVAICPERLRPIAWTPYPVVGGGIDCDGRHNGVLYTSGLHYDKETETLLLLSGEADSNTVVQYLPMSKLEETIYEL